MCTDVYSLFHEIRHENLPEKKNVLKNKNIIKLNSYTMRHQNEINSNFKHCAYL